MQRELLSSKAPWSISVPSGLIQVTSLIASSSFHSAVRKRERCRIGRRRRSAASLDTKRTRLSPFSSS